MNDQPQNVTAEERFANPLPKQIRDQMAEVNALMGIPEQPQDPNQPPQDAEQPDAEQPDAEQPDAEQPPAELQPDQLLYQQEESEDETWEQRARSTYGRLEQAMQTNTQLSRRVSELEQQINGLRLRGAEQQQPQQPGPVAKPKLINETETEEYGSEFFDVVGRRAREEFFPEVETLRQRLARLEAGQQAVTKVVETTQKRTLYDTLYDAVPQWKQINHSPEFHQWLGQLDPYSGRSRQDMLTEAFARQDANRVVNFFAGFVTEATGTPRPPQARTPSAPPLVPPANGLDNGSGKISLETLAAPGRARSVPQPLPPDKSVYTQASIAKFMDDKRTGKYRGREADADAIERDIFRAQHEGRIQP